MQISPNKGPLPFSSPASKNGSRIVTRNREPWSELHDSDERTAGLAVVREGGEDVAALFVGKGSEPSELIVGGELLPSVRSRCPLPLPFPVTVPRFEVQFFGGDVKCTVNGFYGHDAERLAGVLFVQLPGACCCGNVRSVNGYGWGGDAHTAHTAHTAHCITVLFRLEIFLGVVCKMILFLICLDSNSFAVVRLLW